MTRSGSEALATLGRETGGWREAVFEGAPRFTVTSLFWTSASWSLYEAFDRARNERVMIKGARRDGHEDPERIAHEFAVLRPIDHLGLLHVHELFEGAEDIAFSAEWIEGASLLDHLDPERGRLAHALEDTLDELPSDAPAGAQRPARRFDRLRDLFAQIVAALHEIHRRGLVHGEVRPWNVLVTPEGRVVLLDLDTQGARAPIGGNPAYMAPETLRGSPPSPASDFYAVGVILFEALTGRLPCGGSAFLKRVFLTLSEPAPSPATLAPDVPEDLDALCLALLEREPEKRPAWQEILRRLGAEARETPDGAMTPSGGEAAGWREALFEGEPRFTDVRAGPIGLVSVSVFQAFDRARNRRVAIKSVSSMGHRSPEVITHEFEVLHPIAHPNVLRVHDLFVGTEDIAFSSEWIEGTWLLEHLRPLNPGGAMVAALEQAAMADTLDGDLPLGSAFEPDLPRVRSTFAQIVGALHELHRRGILHRNVTPGNVMVTREGRVMLLGLGLSLDLSTVSLLDRHVVVGTPAYMAPEAIRGDPMSAATDFYNVGSMLFEALTGRPPFSSGPVAQLLFSKLRDPAPMPSAFVPGLPEDLDSLCLALLDRDPAQRPAWDDILRRLGAEPPGVP